MVFILWSLGGAICKVLYSFVALIDYYIYGLAGTCFDLIKNIYEYSFFGNAADLINNIRKNIYIVLGVLMMFKIILSAIQYMINPDTFDDKEKGMVGILKNAIITVLLIAFIPVVFDFAMDIQADIVGAIPNIIFGNSIEVSYPEVDKNGVPKKDSQGNIIYQTNKVSPTDSTSGEAVAYAVLQSFFSRSSNQNNWVIEGIKAEDWNRGHRPTSIGTYRRTITGNRVCDDLSVIDTQCYSNPNYYFPEIHDLASFKDHIADGMEKGLDKSEYSYMVLISTAGGVFLVYLLLSMSLDIAIRTIKLGIIQMLAPIPISSYMFKKDNFNKFMTMSGKVYADLFVRMAIIYIVILAVQILVASGILNPFNNVAGGDWLQDIIRNVILIFGLFTFAKSAPKFVTDLLGLPDISGGDIAAMFKRAGAMAGTTGAMYTAGVSNLMANKDKSVGTALRSAIAGSASAGFRGTRAAYNGKGMKEAFKTGHEGAKQARINRVTDKSKGLSGFGGLKTRAKVAIQDFMGVTSTASLANDTIKATDTVISDSGALKGKYMELLGRYGNMVNINHNIEARKILGNLVDRYEDAFTDPKYGSAITPEMLDIISRMQTGKKVSYAEIGALREAIKSSDALKDSVQLQEFARELDDQHETMKGVTAEFMIESMSGKDAAHGGVEYMDSSLDDKYKIFTRGKAKFDKDLDLRIKTAEQHITENAAALDGVGGMHGVQQLLDMFNGRTANPDHNFKAFEGAAKTKGNEARESLASDVEAAARAANERHKQNNQQNGGGKK